MSSRAGESTTFLSTIDFLASTPLQLEKSLSGCAENHAMVRPAQDEWSLGEHICHLRDIEVEGYSVRIRRILDEDRPSLPDIDGDRLAAERNYRQSDAWAALESFKSARSANVEILRSLSDQSLDREGLLEHVGAISLKSLAAAMQVHDREHLETLKKAGWASSNDETA